MEKTEKTISYRLDEGRTDRGVLLISCCKLGSYITEGRSHTEQFRISYSKELKALFEHLKGAAKQVAALNTCAIATIHLDGREFSADTSIWVKLTEVLNEFIMINETNQPDFDPDVERLLQTIHEYKNSPKNIK